MCLFHSGYNGGLTQQLHLELFTVSKLCVANISGQINVTDEEDSYDVDREVFFTVTELPANNQFNVVYYSSNQKGKSVKKSLRAATLAVISGEKGNTSEPDPLINFYNQNSDQ